jgi:hypothetical protein
VKSITGLLIHIWKKYTLIWRFITPAYAAVIFILCIIGSDKFPKGIFFLNFIDVVYHFLGFCILSLLLRGFFYSYKNSLYLALTGGIIWGIFCEVAQIFVPTRSFTFSDLSANLSGIIIIQILLNKSLNFGRN